MVLVGLLLFALVFFALMLWGSIYVVDKLNPYNTFAMALFISAANIGASMMIRFLPFADMIYLVGSLCLLLRLLVAYYQLDLVRALLAAGLTIGAPFLILPKFGEWVGLDFMRLYILCYGFPAVVVVAWQVLRRRTPKDLAEHSPIPRATVANEDRKGKKSRRREETAPVAAVPAVRSAPIVAQAPPPPPRADGEPTMLT